MFDTAVTLEISRPAAALDDDYRPWRRAIQDGLEELEGVTKALACVVDDTMVIVVHGGKRPEIDSLVRSCLPEGITPFVTHR